MVAGRVSLHLQLLMDKSPAASKFRKLRNPLPRLSFFGVKMSHAGRMFLFGALLICVGQHATLAQATKSDVCPRPPAGSIVEQPKDLRSEGGVLKVDFIYRSAVDAK